LDGVAGFFKGFHFYPGGYGSLPFGATCNKTKANSKYYVVSSRNSTNQVIKSLICKTLHT
jgi:hypothetical protein